MYKFVEANKAFQADFNNLREDLLSTFKKIEEERGCSFDVAVQYYYDGKFECEQEVANV